MNKVSEWFGLILVVVIWCSALRLAYKYYEVYEPSKLPIKLEQPEFFLIDKPDVELVKSACEYYGLKHIDVIVAQSVLETGHYKSVNCVKNNNLFGLYNSRRGEYFKFKHWTDCVQAYRDMIQYRLREGEDYFEFLNRIGYAEDREYNNKLKRLIKRMNYDRNRNR